MRLPFFNKKEFKPGLCCLYLLPEKVILAYVVIGPSQAAQLQCIAEKSYSDVKSLTMILKNLIQEYALQNVRCSWLLHSEFYQLLILDKPAVEPDEVAAALRWQLKSLISFSPEEAIIHYFELPNSGKISGKNEIYVSVARRSILQRKADLIRECGLQLEIIDIPELALRNLTRCYGDEDSYLALLLLNPMESTLIITHQKNLLLTRNIPLSMEQGDEMALELQRSFTFCQSQQQKNLAKKLLINPAESEWIDSLAAQLEMEVEAFPLTSLLHTTLDKLSNDQLTAVGGALRTEGGE